MKLILLILTSLVTYITFSGIASATPFKTHVAEFTVTGAPNNQDLKSTLQGILSSRLNPDHVSLVETPDQAERLVVGSYALFGTMFSMDVLIKNREKDIVGKVFEQGEGEGDVIPAIGRLAQKIDAELMKNPIASTPTGAIPIPTPTPPMVITKDAYVLPSEPSAKDAPGNWSSAPLDGVFNSIAPGRTLPSGERELFISGEQTIRAYLKGKELKLLAEISIPSPGKILALDTADLDSDGTPELYVSIIDRTSPASRVYQFSGTTFVPVAVKLPWFFRGIGTEVSSRKIYAQEIERSGKYYGEVKELSKSATQFTAKEPLKLPIIGNIFNFNRLGGTAGSGTSVVLNEDGYLVVYSPDGTEAWKSSEKYGGSERYFNNEPQTRGRASKDLHRWTFLEQRMTLLTDGTLLVPHNEGTFSFGNNRSFDKYTLFAFEWTGAVLKEKWHTRPSPGYLADYAFDKRTGEVLLLEVVQKAGIFKNGTSVISINKIE